MGPETVNKLKDSEIHGDFIGHDKITNIIMFQESEREFVVTHNANIRPVAYFTGRETELQELRQRIEKGRKSVLVSGMGGIGKTHICRKLFEEYLNRHTEDEKEPFRHIGYIEYNGDIGSSLQYCLKFKQQDDPEQNKEAAWTELEYLASDGKLLLFVDDVNVSVGEDSGLKRLMDIPGAIVLTSRRRAFNKVFEPYRIGFLSTEKCRGIYEKIRFENSGKRAEEEEEPDLEYIIDILAARHTITIEFLAHLAWTKQWTVRELRKKLEENGFQLEYTNEEDKLVNIQKSYETLYDMSVLTEAEQNILEAFSIFPYILLKAEICNQWLLADAGVSESDDILTNLYRKGWLQFDMERRSYALHPVFAQFINEKCKPEAEKHMGLIGACHKSLKIPKDGFALECQKYIPFAENIIEQLDIEKYMKRANFISNLAYLLAYIAEYKKSWKMYEKLLGICQTVLGEEHPYVAAYYNDLAYLCMKQEDYENAEQLLEKGLCILEKVLGENHLDTANIYYSLAYLYACQEKYERAEELNEKSLQIRERILGGDDPEVASSYNNLAGVYLEQGKFEKAQKLHERSLQIRKKVLGESHPDTATSYNNLAYLYMKQEEYQIALVYFFKAYRIFVSKLGFDHPHTQIVYRNMGWTYDKWSPDGDFKLWLEEKMKE